jgi:hypothetical protein
LRGAFSRAPVSPNDDDPGDGLAELIFHYQKNSITLEMEKRKSISMNL